MGIQRYQTELYIGNCDVGLKTEETVSMSDIGLCFLSVLNVFVSFLANVLVLVHVYVHVHVQRGVRVHVCVHFHVHAR